MEPKNKTNLEEYLPSKQFRARVIILAILLILALGVYKIASYFKDRLGNRSGTALVVKPEVIQKDSNGNTIPDWEESLWGLNPLKDGDSNREFILAKRETLAKENGIIANSSETISENETLAREFFSILMSLQESGDLDQNAIEAVAKTVGEKIVATPLTDIYTKDTLTTVKANPASTDAYSDAMLAIFDKYEDKDIGRELTFVSIGLTNNDPGAIAQAEAIAEAYRSLGKDLMKVKVPNTISNAHLSLANNYEKVATSIDSLGQMLIDPMVGMKAIINYNKYTDALVADMQTISKNLE